MAWNNQPEWRMTEQEKLLARTEEVRANLETLVEQLPAPTEAPKPAPAKKAYDPGTATVPVKVRPGVYSIDSFRGELKSYTVDLNRGCCDCPHWVERLSKNDGGDCKHLTAARAQHAEELALMAGTLTDAELTALLPKYEAAGRFDIALAVRAELFDRAAICARPPVGTSVKVWGPATESEAAQAWR